MKKIIRVVMIVIAVFAVFSPIVADTMQSAQLNNVQLSTAVGGAPVEDCKELLITCGLLFFNPWCIALAALCLLV